MRALLDTDILIDVLAQRPESGSDTVKLLAMGEMGDFELFVPAQAFTEAFAIMQERNESADVQKAFARCLQSLSVCNLEGTDIRNASVRGWFSFEDCLVACCAEKIKADFLITRNPDAFKRSRVRALTPSALIEWMESDLGLTYDISGL